MEQTESLDAYTAPTQEVGNSTDIADSAFKLADGIFERLDAWGILYSVLIGLVIWAILHRKSFIQFWKWVLSGIREQITASATKMYYQEQIQKLTNELEAEKKRFDDQAREMRADYEAKIKALESKIDALIEANIKNAATIAQLNERVDNLTHRLGKKLTSVGQPKEK